MSQVAYDFGSQRESTSAEKRSAKGPKRPQKRKELNAR